MRSFDHRSSWLLPLASSVCAPDGLPGTPPAGGLPWEALALVGTLAVLFVGLLFLELRRPRRGPDSQHTEPPVETTGSDNW